MPEPTTKGSHVDVLIIGAGPAGLMCALGLARVGINVRIVDKRPSKVAAGQADGIQPRTMEVFQSYGLNDHFLPKACQLHMAAFYNPGPNGIERTGRAPDVTAPTARYPFEATLHQGAIEEIFINELTKLGVSIDRPVVPQSLTLSEDPHILRDPTAYAVKVVLRRLEEDESARNVEVVHAKFVLGSDGAHSWVRKSLGIPMVGESTEYIWGVLDIVPDTNFPDVRNRTAIHSENGSCMIIPREDNKIRLYLQLDPTSGLVDELGRIDKSAVNPALLMQVAQKTMHPYRMDAVGEPEWWSIYMIRQQVASQFSVHERVFIAGDACHTHSPKAGQGMNASMNDSHNLVWKLTHVLRGRAKIDLLKTYESERRKYALDLIAFDKKFAALFSGKPKSPINTDGVSHEQFFAAFQTFGGFTSGIGIHYQPSISVSLEHQAVASGLVTGMRTPPQIIIRAADGRPVELQDLLVADARFKILVFTGKPEGNDVLAAAAQSLESALNAVYGDKYQDVVDIVTICVGSAMEMEYNIVPAVLRSHWTKVYVDETDVTKKLGGKAYESYGVGSEGAVAVIRPDGYVGNVLPLAMAAKVEEYFRGFAT